MGYGETSRSLAHCASLTEASKPNGERESKRVHIWPKSLKRNVSSEHHTFFIGPEVRQYWDWMGILLTLVVVVVWQWGSVTTPKLFWKSCPSKSLAEHAESWRRPSTNLGFGIPPPPPTLATFLLGDPRAHRSRRPRAAHRRSFPG